jgi:hypothetical protein
MINGQRGGRGMMKTITVFSPEGIERKTRDYCHGQTTSNPGAQVFR